MAHTPGPWKVVKMRNVHTGVETVNVSTIGQREWICELGGWDSQGEQANGRLIALSPVMLNILIALVEAHDDIPSRLTDEEWQNARDIIKQAS